MTKCALAAGVERRIVAGDRGVLDGGSDDVDGHVGVVDAGAVDGERVVRECGVIRPVSKPDAVHLRVQRVGAVGEFEDRIGDGEAGLPIALDALMRLCRAVEHEMDASDGDIVRTDVETALHHRIAVRGDDELLVDGEVRGDNAMQSDLAAGCGIVEVALRRRCRIGRGGHLRRGCRILGDCGNRKNR